MVVGRQKPLLSKRHMTGRLEFFQKAPKGLKTHKKKDFLVWWNKDITLWLECQAPRLEETWHYEAWWWKHHVVQMFFSGRDLETSQVRGNEWSKVLREIRDENLLRFSGHQTKQEWLLDKSLICPWVAQPEPELDPNQTSLVRPENSSAATLPIQPDRAWEVLQRSMGTNSPNTDAPSLQRHTLDDLRL